ncbi:MAG: ATP-binding protein [Cyclobacteriaceae bacterium]
MSRLALVALAVYIYPMLIVKAQQTSTGEIGKPFITSWKPKEHGGDSQNWDIVQDDRGVMYFGNNLGILEYDGDSWRLIQLPNKGICRSLAKDNSGRIYVGGNGNFGYLASDSLGQIGFVSMLEYLPEGVGDFSDVWQISLVGNEIYFRTTEYLFKWLPSNEQNSILSGEIKVWEPDNAFHVGFVVNNNLYMREWGKGLLKMQDDSLKLVPNGEKFASERIYVMLPINHSAESNNGKSEEILVGTRSKGLFIYDGQDFKPFKTEVDEYLLKNSLYLPGVVLSDNRLLLNTNNGGAVVIDSNGNLLQEINRANGLPDEGVNYVYQDPSSSGTLWLALQNGIARVEAGGNFSFFDADRGIETGVEKMMRHHNLLYTTSFSGVSYLDESTGLFLPVKLPVTQAWDLIAANNQLLTATADGVYAIEGNVTRPVRVSNNYDFKSVRLIHSKTNDKLMVVGLTDGIAILRLENGNWQDLGRIDGVQIYVSSLIELDDGTIWIGTQAKGVFSFNINQIKGTDLSDVELQHFNENHGLSVGIKYAYNINNVPYFTGIDAIYRFNKSDEYFEVDSTFMEMPSGYSWTLDEDELGNHWVIGDGIAQRVLNDDGSYNWVKSPFRRFTGDGYFSIYPDKDGVVWFGSADKLVRYDSKLVTSNRSQYRTLLRKVTAGDDSLIYGGAGLEVLKSNPMLNYTLNNLSFSYSVPSHDETVRLQFQTTLEGFDNGWSSWSTNSEKEYTNLPSGNYRFRARTRDSSDDPALEAQFSFTILPPWWQTWWAFSTYTLFFLGLALAIGKWQHYRIKIKERQRAQIREANLKAQAENEKRRNVELIGEIGRDITSSLSIERIIHTVYEHVNKLMDASVFGVGIHNKETGFLDFPATKEKGEVLPYYYYDLRDENRLASWCFNNKKEIFMNDFEREHHQYIEAITSAVEGDNSESIIYLPLINKDKEIGVLTAQSFKKNAYNDFHLDILRNIATYAALALENADTYRDLKNAQNQLIYSEKMASLGELTAGIAHEIQNPLNFVNNFSEVNKELIEEQLEELDKGDLEEAKSLARDVLANEEKIMQHGHRAESIVKSMLQHSRGKEGSKEPTDLNALADEYIRLAFHGFRAKDKSFNADFKTEFDEKLPRVNVVPQDIGRVLLNLINNAFQAVKGVEKSLVIVSTCRNNGVVTIKVKDNGPGIPDDIKAKIFQPFFTTKPTGEGTGLGLSMSYDIVTSGHGGTIRADSKNGSGTEFTIELPVS